MKKIHIDPAYLDKALPPVPESLDAAARALLASLPRTKEEKPVKRKSMTVLIIALALVIALTCTALANRFGLLDFIYTYDREHGADVSGMIATDLTLAGDPPAGLKAAVREAFYDGQMVHFLLDITPTRPDTSVVCAWAASYPPTMEEALAYGSTVLALSCEAVVPGGMSDFPGTGIPYAYLRDGPGLSFAYNHILPAEVTMEKLPVEIHCAITDLDTGEMIEASVLTLQIPKTTEPQAVSFLIDRALESIYLQDVAMAYTPLELSVSITYHPLYQAYPEIGLLAPDGTISPASSMLMHRGAGELETVRMIWGAPGEMPQTLALWVYNTDEVLLLHTATGDATLHPATVSYDESPPSLSPGFYYVGDEVVRVMYDEEVLK